MGDGEVKVEGEGGEDGWVRGEGRVLWLTLGVAVGRGGHTGLGSPEVGRSAVTWRAPASPWRRTGACSRLQWPSDRARPAWRR
jgi:hypothetical protein